jgi:hypothetical protein
MDDLISRRQAIDALRKKQDNGKGDISRFYNTIIQHDIEAIMQLPSALGTNLAEVGTDLIFRWQAIDALRNYLVGKNVPCDGTLTCRLIENEVINKLPSAQPEQRTGKWIKLDMHRGMADHKCTACGQECYVPTCMGEPLYAFCPNCGSYNGGEQDE